MKIVLSDTWHAELLSAYYLRNDERFQPWNPQVSTNHHSVMAWDMRLQQVQADFRNGRSAHFIGVSDDDSLVLGACSLSNIIRGPFLACYMGYSVDGDYEGRGVMTDIVRHAIDYGFRELGLNRIMANYMPANRRSGRLLEKLGFEREGRARRYLCINGRWEDHILTSLLNPRTPQVGPR